MTSPGDGASGAFQNATCPGGGRHSKPAPFSLRLTFEERARLEYEAGDQPLGAYIRSRLFDDTQPRQRRRGKRPVKDHQILARLLGDIGRARLANNLNQLARCANSGSLPVTPETEAALRSACAEIHALRKNLLQ